MKYLISFVIIGIIISGGFVLAQDLDQKAVNIWKTMWEWIKRISLKIWDPIYSFLNKEVEQRRPDVEQEFQKEVQEMKEDIPRTTKTLWERLKDLFN